MPILPGQIIDLDQRQLEALGTELSSMIDDLEADYSPLFKDIHLWWRWYEAVPKMKVKNFPFANASNLVVPLIQTMSDSLLNRFYAAIFGTGRNRIWIGTTENEAQERQVNDVVKWINWAANGNDFNYRLAIYDWLSELVPIGSSVLALNWRDEVRHVFAHQGRGAARTIVSRPVRFARGPLFEHIPREQILWDTNYLICEAPLVVRELAYSWSQLNYIASSNEGWQMDVVDELRLNRGRGGPSTEIAKDKDHRDGRESGRHLARELDIRECHIDWPILDSMGIVNPDLAEVGQPTIPLVVTLSRNLRKVLWVRAEPYFFPYKPFFDGFFKKRSGRGHSVGVAKRLEAMQQGLTVILNQAIDSRTRANAVWAVTNSRELMTKPIDPSHPIFTSDMDGFRELSMSTNNFQDMNLFNLVNVIAERQTGQADPALGRESRQGGHPSPATSTLALLQQSDVMSAATRELIRLQVGRMGESVASLYQQYETNEDGRLERVLGPTDAQSVSEFIFPTDPVSSVMQFDVSAMNESLNPQSEMQRALAVTQANTQYWAFILQAKQVLMQAAQQGDPIGIQVAKTAIEAQTKAHMRFLEAGDIDDVEKYVLQLSRAAGAGTADIQRAAVGLGDMAQARGAVQQPSLAGLPSSIGGGAGAPNGGVTYQ